MNFSKILLIFNIFVAYEFDVADLCNFDMEWIGPSLIVVYLLRLIVVSWGAWKDLSTYLRFFTRYFLINSHIFFFIILIQAFTLRNGLKDLVTGHVVARTVKSTIKTAFRTAWNNVKYSWASTGNVENSKLC